VKLHRAAYAVALLTLLLHLIFNHRYGYYRDEFYFIDCAKHLAWGYVDQPPLAPLVTWLTAPFGYALWAIRLLPAIMAAVTVLFCCAIARQLGGGVFSQVTAGIAAALAPGYLALGWGLSTEFLSPAAWTALIYCTILLVQKEDKRLYVPIALIVAAGMYAKYSIAACAIALAFGLLVTGRRNLLQSWWLPAGVAIVAILLLPNALWQLQHGMPMLGVIHGDQLNRHQLANGAVFESAHWAANAVYFIATQFIYQHPVLSILWVWGLIALVTKPFRDTFLFLPVAYALLVILIVATVGRGYYLEGFYPCLFAAGAVAMERALARKAAWLRPGIVALEIAVAAILVPFVLPLLSLPAYKKLEMSIGMSRPAPDGTRHLANPLFADQVGWEPMVKMVAGVYHALPPARRKATAIFADRYADAGAIDFYGPKYGLPPVISPNNTYYLWGPRDYSGDSVIAVGATDYPLLLRAFRGVHQVAVYRDDDRWVLEGPLPIYLCTQPHAPLAKLWPMFKYYGL